MLRLWKPYQPLRKKWRAKCCKVYVASPLQLLGPDFIRMVVCRAAGRKVWGCSSPSVGRAGAAWAPCRKGRGDVLLHSASSAIHRGSKGCFHRWNLLHLHWVIYLQYSVDNLLKLSKVGVNLWVFWHKNDWKSFNYAVWNSLHSMSFPAISTVEILASEMNILKCRI